MKKEILLSPLSLSLSLSLSLWERTRNERDDLCSFEFVLPIYIFIQYSSNRDITYGMYCVFNNYNGYIWKFYKSKSRILTRLW